MWDDDFEIIEGEKVKCEHTPDFVLSFGDEPITHWNATSEQFRKVYECAESTYK